MAFNNRKILDPFQPRKDLKSPIFVSCSYSPPQRDFSFLVSMSICMVGSILLFLFLSVFIYLYVTKLRRRYAATVIPSDINRREDDVEAGDRDFSDPHHVWRITTVGLDRSVIDSITVVGFKKGEGNIDGTECSICLNEFEEEESLRLLPKCNHAFHKNCIDTWLHSHKNCPLCRAPILLTEPRHQETERNQQSTSESSIDLSGEEEESSGSRNLGFTLRPRAKSNLASQCGSGNVKSVRRSFSIGGSSSIKACDDDEHATGSRRRFYTSLSANFFSSSRRPRNQEQVLTNQIP